ncbi:MAG TPA: methylmalonyl-CoA epimerase [Rhodothermales bacterium]|nr:methylmalonyl-CoA epimerase [Rhodothermales bacterium]
MIQPKAVHHIGIAVHSIEEHRPYYEDVLGARFEGVEEVPGQHVRVGFFVIGSEACPVRLELLEPASPESTIAAFLEKRGEGLHHVAYAVEGIRERLDDLRRGGVRLVDDVPRQGAHQMQVAFLHPKSTGGVLTELCEPSGSPLKD